MTTDILCPTDLTARVVRRYWVRVADVADHGCWSWKGGIGPDGRPRFWITPQTAVPAHTVAWALAHPGLPLPDNIWHTCRHAHCQNPEHLINKITGIHPALIQL